MSEKLNDEREAAIKEKINIRGKIQLIYYKNFKEELGINLTDAMQKFEYKEEKEIIKEYENNIENNKYFNVIFFKYDNKESAFAFLKSFMENAEEKAFAKNNSDYPFFIFFENPNFTKEILYSYYLENTKEMEISRFYQIKSFNIYFLRKKKEEIERLLEKDITNYYYECDFKDDSHEINTYKIEMLFMGQTGCGKSTFINSLLGKLRAFSASMNNFKSLGGLYTHSKYPLSIKDSEGFEMNSNEQEQKMFAILDKNLKEDINNRTHIAFYLIPGPYNSNRDLDYSCIGSLLKLEEYNIHYYLIMTKDPDEGKNFAKASLRFLNGIIKKSDFSKIKTDLSQNKLKEMLGKIRDKLEGRIFSVDVSKKESKTLKELMNKIYDDLKTEKEANEGFINKLTAEKEKGSEFEIDFSGSEIIMNKNKYEIPEKIKKSPFFNIKKFGNDDGRRKKAREIIKEAQDVSSFRKFFFCYNSKIVQNRKNMLKEILSLYDFKNLNIELIENRLSKEEKNEWFYQHNCTEQLGNKIINICEEEQKKIADIDRYIGYCFGYNKSIDEIGNYIKEISDFNLNGVKIPYDCELKVK